MKRRARSIIGAIILIGIIAILLQRSSETANAQRTRGRQPPPPTIPGDFDHNWYIDNNDLSMFRTRYGSDNTGGQLCEAYDVDYDLWPWDSQNNLPTPDGKVDLDDFWTMWYSNPSQVHTDWQSGDVTGWAAKTGCASGYPDAPPDDYVDFRDFEAFAAHWMTTPASPNWDPIFDFCDQNGRKAPGAHAPVPMDNVVDFYDLMCLSDAWHAGDGPAPPRSLKKLGRATQGGLQLDINGATPGIDAAMAAAQGDVVEVTVRADGVEGLVGYDFKLRYDARALELLTWTQEEGNFLQSRGGKALFMKDQNTPGVLWLTGALVGSDRGRAPRGGGVLAHVSFRVAQPPPGKTPISLADAVICDTERRFAVCDDQSVRIAVRQGGQVVADAMAGQKDGRW